MKTSARIRTYSPAAGTASALMLGTCMTGLLPLAAQEAAPAKPEAEKKVPLEKKAEG